MKRVRIVLLSPWVEYLLGPGPLFVGGVLSPWWVKILVGTPGFLLVAGSRYFGNRARERSDARYTIARLLTVVVNTFAAVRPAPVDRSLRANLMIIDKPRACLRIAYFTPGYGDGELGLEWGSGQGCAGEAWRREETIFAPEDGELPVSVETTLETHRPWNMTPEQIRLTAGTISSVLSVPVFVPDGSIAGVLNLDDQKPLAQSLLGSEDVRAATEELAGELGALLEKSGTVS
jgi:hypothetical protein